MSKLRISLACVPTDRTRPILDGRIQVAGCEIEAIAGEPEEIFGRALNDAAFDVTELSMASHILRTAGGKADYVGVPAFTSRAFRHSSIYVRSDRSIKAPQDLAGRLIGLPDYQQTAALWVRGILLEHYGVRPSSISWRTGGLDRPGRGQRGGLNLPSHMDVRPIDAADTLNDALKRGDLDGIIAPRPPACFSDGAAHIVRLFPDFVASERQYASKSGYFPIMHCMAVRRDVAAAHPWLPAEIFRAFSQAKLMALNELLISNVLRVSLPWLGAHVEEARNILGARFWSYGFSENKRELEAMVTYAAADGLIRDVFPVEDLFAPLTHDLGEEQ
jgi:4,5-dihydroxyphthalate decarboxylase